MAKRERFGVELGLLFLKKINRNTTPNFHFLKNYGYCASKVVTTIPRLSFVLTLYVQIGCRFF